MFNKNRVTRRGFTRQTAAEGAEVTAARALGAQAITAMTAGVPRKWNRELDVAVVGLAFCGMAAVITAGDPSKITLLF